jgi:hypothetical protein
MSKKLKFFSITLLALSFLVNNKAHANIETHFSDTTKPGKISIVFTGMIDPPTDNTPFTTKPITIRLDKIKAYLKLIYIRDRLNNTNDPIELDPGPGTIKIYNSTASFEALSFGDQVQSVSFPIDNTGETPDKVKFVNGQKGKDGKLGAATTINTSTNKPSPLSGKAGKVNNFIRDLSVANYYSEIRFTTPTHDVTAISSFDYNSLLTPSTQGCLVDTSLPGCPTVLDWLDLTYKNLLAALPAPYKSRLTTDTSYFTNPELNPDDPSAVYISAVIDFDFPNEVYTDGYIGHGITDLAVSKSMFLSVPGPFPIAGGMVFFSFSRKMRKRVNASHFSKPRLLHDKRSLGNSIT